MKNYRKIELENFYHSKKIFLTGNTGFKGTWMNIMLEQMGALVWGYALPLGNPRVPDQFYQKVKPCVSESIFGDIANTDLLIKSIEKCCPDIIFHLASHSSLNRSMEEPHYILKTNIMGTLNILEAARQTPSVKAVIIVTSDKVYQNLDTDICYKEDSPLGGNDPYATSKVCQELLTQCYDKSFFEGRQNIATARASNVIGPGDYNLTRLFPYLMEEYCHNRIPSIRNPNAIRPWQSVMDIVMGYLMLGKYLYETDASCRKQNNIAYNFGPMEDSFVTVAELAELVSHEFGNQRFIMQDSLDQIKHEAKILKLDSSKAMDELGWKPEESLSKCIHRCIQFTQKERAGMDIAQLAREYVSDYLREWRCS